MNEADSHNQGSSIPAFSESINGASSEQVEPSPPSPAEASSAEWQTINFPGALPVDAIPLEVPNPMPLEQENRELRDRLQQLEQDMAQQQIQFQLEIARSLQAEGGTSQESKHPNSQFEELQKAQAQIEQLFQELEHSQQTAQRQQILVETLSLQLESSQERIAQLERDCALAQQRYNDQVQQLQQVESTCHDLRTRLHRQQRQTLQFKAALEKCLEMPPAPAQGNAALFEAGGVPLQPPVVHIPPVSLSQVVTPKNQPVRPWSATTVQAGGSQESKSPEELSQPLLKIVKAPASPPPHPTDVAAATPIDLNTDDLSQIFADTSLENSYPQPADPAAAIFDLSPFLEDANSLSTQKESTETQEQSPARQRSIGDHELLKMLAAVPLDSEDLAENLSPFPWVQSNQKEDGWDDLMQLINSDPAADSPTTVNSEQVDPQTPVSAEIPPSQPGTDPSIEDGEKNQPSRDRLSPQLVDWKEKSVKPLNLEEKPTAAAAVDDSPRVASKPFTFDIQTKPAATEKAIFSGDRLSATSPSPVVYPLRTGKKVKSLSAVELPTFPKAK
jgi:hypothetical protein